MPAFNNIDDLLNHFQNNENERTTSEKDDFSSGYIDMNERDRRAIDENGVPVIKTTVKETLAAFDSSMNFNVKHGVFLKIEPNKLLDISSQKIKDGSMSKEEIDDFGKKLLSSMSIDVSENPSGIVPIIVDLVRGVSLAVVGLKDLGTSCGKSLTIKEIQEKILGPDPDLRETTGEEFIKEILNTDKLTDKEKSVYLFLLSQSMYMTLLTKLINISISPILQIDKDILNNEYLSTGEYIIDKIYRDGGVNLSKNEFTYALQKAVMAFTLFMGDIEKRHEKSIDEEERKSFVDNVNELSSFINSKTREDSLMSNIYSHVTT